MPLLEFTVDGPPVSYQTKDRANLHLWMTTVRNAAAAVCGTNPALTGRLKCTIINFHEGSTAPLDDDNMVKPIRDALNGLVYDDDRQITYSETIQVCIDDPFKIRRGSAVLLAACNKGVPFVYVRIDPAPDFIQFPQ
jgi:hypothetical protein